MRVLKAIGGILVVMLILFYGISLFLPTEVHVERSTVIPASSEIVFEQVNDLRNWKEWSPIHQQSENLKITYEGFLEGEGASYIWESSEIGSGKLTITESRKPIYIATDVQIMNEGSAKGYYRFEQIDDYTTRVTWTLETEMDNDPVSKYMGLVMDTMIGPEFEEGLEKLKYHVESIQSDDLIAKDKTSG